MKKLIFLHFCKKALQYIQTWIHFLNRGARGAFSIEDYYFFYL